MRTEIHRPDPDLLLGNGARLAFKPFGTVASSGPARAEGEGARSLLWGPREKEQQKQTDAGIKIQLLRSRRREKLSVGDSAGSEKKAEKSTTT